MQTECNEVLDALRELLIDIAHHKDELEPYPFVCELWAQGKTAVLKADNANAIARANARVVDPYIFMD